MKTLLILTLSSLSTWMTFDTIKTANKPATPAHQTPAPAEKYDRLSWEMIQAMQALRK